MDWKQLIPFFLALAAAATGGTGWYNTAQSYEWSAARLRASKELNRACMGEVAFEAEWKQVLADLREASPTEAP